MKIIAVLLIAALLLLMPIAAGAANFGVNPYTVDVGLDKGASVDLQFAVVEYNGLIEISTEDLPVIVVNPSLNTMAGSKILVTLKCKEDAVPGNYKGKIVFLAKGGSSVLSGIKVLCNLTINSAINTYAVSSPLLASNLDIALIPSKKGIDWPLYILLGFGAIIVIVIIGLAIRKR